MSCGRERVPIVLLLVALLTSTAPLVAEGSAPDVPGLMKQARRTQRADFEAWARFSFYRHVIRQRLGQDGVATRTEVLEFEVAASEAGFDEELVRIDGRKPFASEVREHRRAGRFAKHYGQVRAGEDVDQGQGFSLAWLTQFPSYRYAGVEEVRGIKCYRLDFEPGMDSHAEHAVTRVPSHFVEVMAGSLWIAQLGHHLVRARVWTVRPVRVSFGVARIMDLEVVLDAGPVSDDTWLPDRISVQSHLAILGKDIRKRNVFTYKRFRETRGGS